MGLRTCPKVEALGWSGFQGRALRVAGPSHIRTGCLLPHCPAPSMPGAGSQGELSGTVPRAQGPSASGTSRSRASAQGCPRARLPRRQGGLPGASECVWGAWCLALPISSPSGHCAQQAPRPSGTPSSLFSEGRVSDRAGPPRGQGSTWGRTQEHTVTRLSSSPGSRIGTRQACSLLPPPYPVTPRTVPGLRDPRATARGTPPSHRLAQPLPDAWPGAPSRQRCSQLFLLTPAHTYTPKCSCPSGMCPVAHG